MYKLSCRIVAGCGLLLMLGAPGFGEKVKTAFLDANGRWVAIDKPAWRQPALAPAPEAKQRLATANGTYLVTYRDVELHNGIGFDDPAQGAARRAVVAALVQYVGGVITNTGVCEIQMGVSETDGRNAQAVGTMYFDFLIDDLNNALEHFVTAYAWRHLAQGSDPSFSLPDLKVTVDFGFPMYAGTGTVPADRYDLFTVVLQELIHGLGMMSASASNGASAAYPKVFTAYDDLLYAGDGVKLWNAAGAFQWRSSVVLNGAAPGVFFRGAQTMSEYGSAIPVYTPSSYSTYLSLEHWAASVQGKPVMEPSLRLGTAIRTFQRYELRTLIDLGYLVNMQAAARTAAGPPWRAYE